VPTSGEIREPDKVAVGLQVLLLGTEGIEPFLAEVARWAAGTVGSAHSCGLTVSATARTPRMGATSDELAQRMDAVQYDVEDGPCLTCLRDGIIVRVGDLGMDSRWPAFAARGRQEGVGASLSVPMLVGDHVAGAVNLYATKRYSLNEEDLGRARHFADQAAGAVALAVRLAEREEKAKNLEIALTSRSTIDQALGIVMAQAHISAEEAFQVLRARSQHRNIKIRDVAAAVIAELAGTRLRPRDGDRGVLRGEGPVRPDSRG
jgi:GAF domain-containing protein